VRYFIGLLSLSVSKNQPSNHLTAGLAIVSCVCPNAAKERREGGHSIYQKDLIYSRTGAVVSFVSLRIPDHDSYCIVVYCFQWRTQVHCSSQWRLPLRLRQWRPLAQILREAITTTITQEEEEQAAATAVEEAMQVEAITPLWWQLGAPYAEIELRENITEPLPVTVAKDSSAAPCVRITSTLAG